MFADIDPERLVSMDDTAMDRTHGRAPSGVCVDGLIPQGHRKVTTLTAAVCLDGVPESAGLAFGRAADVARLETYVGSCLMPALRPEDIVVMDNLGSHTRIGARAMVRLLSGDETRETPGETGIRIDTTTPRSARLAGPGDSLIGDHSGR